MPALDYALVCDYVRAEGGVAHVIAAGVDTYHFAEVPASANLGLLLRATFTRNECGRRHTIELIFQDADGARLAQVQATTVPDWPDDHPAGWPVGTLLGLNVGVPFPSFGDYALEILVNGSSLKSIPLRAVQRAD